MGCRQKNRQVCQNFILLLHKNILRKKFTMFFFRSSNGFFPNSGRKLGASLSELHCTWPEEPFAENTFFRKATSFAFVFRFFLNFFGCRQKKHRHVCQNWILPHHRNTFRRKTSTFSCFFSGFSRKVFELLAN